MPMDSTEDASVIPTRTGRRPLTMLVIGRQAEVNITPPYQKLSHPPEPKPDHKHLQLVFPMRRAHVISVHVPKDSGDRVAARMPLD
jgi:hypothetical protein